MLNRKYTDEKYNPVEWHNYRDLKNKCKNFDFKIHVDGDSYPVHQDVLKRSQYFNCMFKFNYVESQSKIVTFTSDIITSDTIELLLNYYYTGELYLNEMN